MAPLMDLLKLTPISGYREEGPKLVLRTFGLVYFVIFLCLG
jgi:hypothetical protein